MTNCLQSTCSLKVMYKAGSLGRQDDRVLPGELPLERFDDLVIARLEAKQRVFKLRCTGKVVRWENLRLCDRVADLDLVEAA